MAASLALLTNDFHSSHKARFLRDSTWPPISPAPTRSKHTSLPIYRTQITLSHRRTERGPGDFFLGIREGSMRVLLQEPDYGTSQDRQLSSLTGKLSGKRGCCCRLKTLRR